MSVRCEMTDDVIIVGGGISGLSIAAVLAMEGIPVTLLEASDLGFAASTCNQGWLYSGAWFAPRQVDLARMCYESWQRTIRFCPDCLEPGHTGMVFATTSDETRPEELTDAWAEAGIPFSELSADSVKQKMPQMDVGKLLSMFHVPDRSFRPHVLLRKIADVATSHGARIHTHAKVTELVQDDGKIVRIVTSEGDEIKSSFVVIATGASQADLSRYVGSGSGTGCQQSVYERVTLMAHLVAVTPQVCHQPFCLVDCNGFNHMPHLNQGDVRTSVFGLDRWNVVNPLESCVPCESTLQLIRDTVAEFFPASVTDDSEVQEWSGTTVQAMHVDQVQPGLVPRPTVIDHAQESPCVSNMLSVYPGRATLWTHLAADAATEVLKRLDRSSGEVSRPPWA